MTKFTTLENSGTHWFIEVVTNGGLGWYRTVKGMPRLQQLNEATVLVREDWWVRIV